MKNKSLFALQVVTEEKIIVGSLKPEDCYKLLAFNMQVTIIIKKVAWSLDIPLANNQKISK
jgi:hypothetical protein